jgi:hypothetical protein
MQYRQTAIVTTVRSSSPRSPPEAQPPEARPGSGFVWCLSASQNAPRSGVQTKALFLVPAGRRAAHTTVRGVIPDG